MAVYEIGNYIHDMRVERGYSQEELCFGICSVGNLSKIENGTRMPNRKTVEAWLPRGIFAVFQQRRDAAGGGLQPNCTENYKLRV